MIAAFACAPALAGFDRAEISRPAAGDAATGDAATGDTGGDTEGDTGWCEITVTASGSATLRLKGQEATLSTPEGGSCRILSAVCGAQQCATTLGRMR